MAIRSPLVVSAVAVWLSACAAGPDYQRPPLDVPAAYKEETGAWKTAEPRPVESQVPWWTGLGDPVLDALMQDAERANLSLRQAEAQYRQARALADAAHAGLFPTLGASAGVTRARTDTNGVRVADVDTLGLSASWEPDLWGSVRRAVEAGRASEQASADDLAAAHLSLQTTLAQDYVQLRIVDQQIALYASTSAAYARALALTQAQHAAGVALASDVALARSQLASAQAAGVDLEATRAQLEHAIAVLTGRAPAQFQLPAQPAGQELGLRVPAGPAGLPAALLEHRPDIAAAERRVAAANAQIGVARAAYFPTLTLAGSAGFDAAALSRLFDTPSRVWSLGAALAQTLFDGGLRSARTAQAQAAYDLTVAEYKATVLAGFQQVEDELSTLRVLDHEAQLQDQAVQAAALAERLALAQYRAGSASYLSVITAQQSALASQRAAVVLRGRRIAAAIGLVAATGGGWNADDRPHPAVPASAGAAQEQQP